MPLLFIHNTYHHVSYYTFYLFIYYSPLPKLECKLQEGMGFSSVFSTIFLVPISLVHGGRGSLGAASIQEVLPIIKESFLEESRSTSIANVVSDSVTSDIIPGETGWVGHMYGNMCGTLWKWVGLGIGSMVAVAVVVVVVVCVNCGVIVCMCSGGRRERCLPGAFRMSPNHRLLVSPSDSIYDFQQV